MSDPGVLDPGGDFDKWMMVNGPYVFGGCLTIFGVGFLIGGVAQILDAFRAKSVARRMHTFPSVPGEVLESKQLTYTTRHGSTMYYPFIQYRYVVNGKEFKDHHVLPGEFAPGYGTEWVDAWLAAYPVGRQIEVFIDPRNPKISVVERQAAPVKRNFVGDVAVGLMLVGVALFALYSAIFKILPEGGKPLPPDFGKPKTVEVPPPPPGYGP